jgi:hypothetical protein
MEYIIIALFAAIVLSIFSKTDSKSTKTIINDSDSNKVYNFNLPKIPEGYYPYEMVGMYYRGITPEDFGVDYGFVAPEKDNKHDPYAIAVYRGSDYKHVGYLPAGNSTLHRILTYRGGRADAIFRIQGSSQYCYGDVYVEEKYKVFRTDNIKEPYRSQCVKLFCMDSNDNHEGKMKCWLTTKYSKDEYDYTVTAVDEDNIPIGNTDDNQLQLFDYVNEQGDMIPACCEVTPGEDKVVIHVPLNYTEKTINKKIEEFLNS